MHQYLQGLADFALIALLKTFQICNIRHWTSLYENYMKWKICWNPTFSSIFCLFICGLHADTVINYTPTAAVAWSSSSYIQHIVVTTTYHYSPTAAVAWSSSFSYSIYNIVLSSQHTITRQQQLLPGSSSFSYNNSSEVMLLSIPHTIAC